MPHRILGSSIISLAVCVGLASSLVSLECGAAEPARPVFPYPLHQTVLENGLKLVTVPFDSPGTLSYYTIVRTGSRNEVEPGLSGFAHFFEHMMFRGTPRHTAEQYNDALKQFGVDSNAFTTDDWTCYHITAPAAALERIIDLEADRFQNLLYDQPGFQKEARAVLGEYNKAASSPLMPLDEKMQDTAFTRHTYKHTTIGFLADIVDMPNQYEYSRKFFQRWYRPDNCIVLVVGDVKHDLVVQFARRHYSAWKPGTAQVEIPKEPPQTEEKRVALPWPNPTLPYLSIGYHVPGFDPLSSDIAALDILAEALFSKSSPLYRYLVLEYGKVDQIFAGASFRRDPTLFTILIRLRDAADFDYVERSVYEVLREAITMPLEPQRLADIKSHLRYSFSPDTTDQLARTLGEYLQLTGDPESLNQTYAGYERATAADVQRVAAKYFGADNRTVVTLASGKASARSADESAKAEAKSQGSEFSVARPRAVARVLGDAHAAQAKPSLPAGEQPQVVELPTDSTNVALRIAFRAGSQNDPPGKEGLAALTARLLAEGGTQELAYQELVQKLYPIAGQMGSNCDKELTIFTGKVHRDKLAEFYGLFADTLLRPRFDPADFERLRKEQINYLSSTLRGNDDENLGKWALQLALYRDHPYGHVDAGTAAGLKAITLDDVKQFYQQHYLPQNAQLGVAAKRDAEFVSKLKSDFSAGLPRGKPSLPTLPKPAEAAKTQALELTMVEKPCIATAISIGAAIGITRADADFYPLLVANSAFGEHRTFNGRLMQRMRGKRGLNYGDYAYIENFLQQGAGTFAMPNVPRRQQYFSIWIRPVPHDKAVFALRQAVRELDLLVREGLTPEEFESSRNFLFHYSKLWVQDPSRRLGYEMDGAFYGRKSLVAELQQRLPEVTLEQVNAAIRNHLPSQNLAVAVVTNDAGKLQDQMLSGQSTPLVYDTQGTPADILAEDKQIAVWPLKIDPKRIRVVPTAEMFEK